MLAHLVLEAVSGVEGESVSYLDILAPDRGVMLLFNDKARSSSFLSGEIVCCRKDRTGTGDVGVIPANRGVKA